MPKGKLGGSLPSFGSTLRLGGCANFLFLRAEAVEALCHDGHGRGTFVDHDEAATVAAGGFACGATASEEVEYGIAGVGVDPDDAFEDAEWLLGGVACLLLTGRGDDGVPPDVGRGLAAGGFFAPTRPGAM